MRWPVLLVVAIQLTATAPTGAQPAKQQPLPEMDSLNRAPRDAFNPFGRLSESLQGKAVEDDFLHPDAAFILSTEVRNAGTVIVRWTLADGYYLYRDKFKFALMDAQGIELGPVQIPPGEAKEDEFFGRVEVYYNQVQADIALHHEARQPTAVTLEVGYQGCADAGLCYMPITKAIPLALPAISGVPAARPVKVSP